MDFTVLPTLNAILNSTSAILVVAGVYFIKRKNIAAHKRCIFAAIGVSVLFLSSYLVYHFQVGSVRFDGNAPIRTLYLAILLSHTILAVVIVPLILRSAYLGFKNRFDEHRRITKWTYPLWIYVSVTGVVVYLMLYKL